MSWTRTSVSGGNNQTEAAFGTDRVVCSCLFHDDGPIPKWGLALIRTRHSMIVDDGWMIIVASKQHSDAEYDMQGHADRFGRYVEKTMTLLNSVKPMTYRATFDDLLARV